MAAANNDLDALNNASKSLTDLQVAISLVADHLKSLERHTRNLHLHFDDQDQLEGVSYDSAPENVRPASDDGFIFIRSDCEWLPKYVDSLWEAQPKADHAVASLPKCVTEELNGLVGKPWVSSVRRHCLDLILKWPGEIHHQTSYAAFKVSGTVEELLEHSERYSPYQTWERYKRRLLRYGHDLFAVRGVVLPSPGEVIQPEAITPPIILNGPGQPITVKGKEKPPVTAAQYDVLTALVAAGQRGLNKDELPEKSQHGDAVRILGRIAEKDEDWRAIIGIAGQTGGRYRILGLH